MSYDHSFEAHLTSLPGVSLDQIKEACKPLLEYVFWGEYLEEFLENNKIEIDGCSICFEKEENNTFKLYFSTWGDTGDSHQDYVKQLAEDLKELVEPGYMTLINQDTVDLEDAVQTFWIKSDGFRQEQLHVTIEKVRTALEENSLFSPEVIESILANVKNSPLSDEAKA